jgi:hypothetical protein
MGWNVLIHEEFEPELNELVEEVQNELLAYAKLRETYGPLLYADLTLIPSMVLVMPI